MKPKLEIVPGNIRGDYVSALQFAGATVYFLDGEPVAYLLDARLHASISISPKQIGKLVEAFPFLGALPSSTVSERSIEGALLFREWELYERLHRAFAAMPYGGIANFNFGEDGRGMDFEQIAGNVERLRKVLEDHAERDKKDTAERVRLGQAVAGFGELLKLALEYANGEKGEDD